MKRSFSKISGNGYQTPAKYRRLNNDERQANEDINQIRRDIQEIKDDIYSIRNDLDKMKASIQEIKLFVGMEYRKFPNPPSYIF